MKIAAFYFLPILSGLILTLTLLNTKFAFLLLGFLLPLFIFLDKAPNKKTVFLGGILMGIFYALPGLIIGLWPSPEAWGFIKNYYNPVPIIAPEFFIFIFFIGLGLLISLLYGLFSLCVYTFLKKKEHFLLFSLPALWLILEFLKRKILFDLSWGDIGYNFIDYPYFAATSAFWGKYGVAFFIILINTLFYLLIKKKIKYQLGIFYLFFVFLGTQAIGFWSIKNTNLIEGNKIRIAVIQGYLPWEIKPSVFLGPDDEFSFPPPYDLLIEKLISSKEKVDIILLPEEILHFNPLKISQAGFPAKIETINDYWLTERETILNILKKTGARVFVIGQPTIYNNRISANSFLVFTNDDKVGVYLKQRLFPFIERGIIFRRSDWVLGGYGTLPGTNSLKIDNLGTLFLVSCIEIENDGLFNNYLTNEPTVILTGGSEFAFNEIARKYQLRLARFRAIEQRKYLARATKAGYSVVIDPFGRVITQTLSSNQNEILFADIYLNKEKTFYSQIGELPFLILSFLLVAIEILKKAKQ